MGKWTNGIGVANMDTPWTGCVINRATQSSLPHPYPSIPTVSARARRSRSVMGLVGDLATAASYIHLSLLSSSGWQKEKTGSGAGEHHRIISIFVQKYVIFP